MRPAGRRRPKESVAQEWKPPATPSSVDPWQHMGSLNRRDSDASLCSSRPSSCGNNRSAAAAAPLTDRGYQLAAIRTINSYLASNSSQISLKPPLPSAKDITETLKFILHRLEFPPTKVEEDLPLVLKFLNCPLKINKSAIKAPGTPHSWPSLLGVIHWLVQIAMYNDHSSDPNQARSIFEDNSMFNYAMTSYLHFIRGDDDSVDAIDREFMEKLQQERNLTEEKVKSVADHVAQLEGTLDAMRTQPSQRESLEKEKSVLEEDIKKFQALIDQLNGHMVNVEKALEEKENELEAKVVEEKKIREENEELKKSIQLQGINSRDAERMKRELQAVERDIGEAEVARNAWEEKVWELDSTIGHTFKDLEALSMECNQAVKRLKIGNGFQYELNAKGSTPSKVLGIDYKTKLKPELTTFANDIKRNSMENLEELLSLQQQASEYAAKIEAKRNRLASLQSRIDEREAQLNAMQKETEEYTARCVAEANRMVEDIDADDQKLITVEGEAAEFLKTSKQQLQDAIVQDEEETQACAGELFGLVDTVSRHKEHMSSKIAEMKSTLLETGRSVSDMHKGSLTSQLGTTI